MRLGGLLLACTLVLTGCGSASTGAAGSDLPGGTTGKKVLADHSFLDKDDRVRFGESEPAAEVQSAICDYVFGKPEEVGRTARLTGKVTLNKASGFNSAGSNGVGFQCGYDVSGKTALALVIWTEDSNESDNAEHVVSKKLGDKLYGYSGYAPGYKGSAMSTSTAGTWLTEAGKRVAAS
jgi:hypothetical protein